MRDTPELNSSWNVEGGAPVVRAYEDVDVNIVTGQGPGSQVTCLRQVNKLGLASIAELMASSPPSTDVGTFSIVNLGQYGTKSVAPVILQPQAGMLGVGAAGTRVVPNPKWEKGNGEEMYMYREYMTVTLSCDHRVVDGAVGAKWLQSFKAMLENPETMLL